MKQRLRYKKQKDGEYVLLTLPKSGPIVHHPHIVCKNRRG